MKFQLFTHNYVCLTKYLQPRASRWISTTPVNFAAKNKSHYDVLGVTPKATQGDIKSAYYKLSMIHHPDRNKGSSEALAKFREISEAYEVLGNYKLRRLYDKGIIHTAGGQYKKGATEVEDDPETKFYKSRQFRDRPPPPSGRTPIYNFDEWTKAHYGESFARRQKLRNDFRAKQRVAELNKSDIKTEKVLMCVLVFVIAIFYYTTRQDDPDIVKAQTQPPKQDRKPAD